MMPTSVLTGVNATGQTVAKRDFEEELELEKRSSSGATALSLAPLATIAFTVLAAAIAL
jgi:hypothetical protein